MNDLSMLDPDETLAVQNVWPDDDWRNLWTRYRCIPCLLTRGVGEAWTWTDFRPGLLRDDNTRPVPPPFTEAGIVAAYVPRQDFYDHLLNEHKFHDNFASVAARRIK